MRPFVGVRRQLEVGFERHPACKSEVPQHGEDHCVGSPPRTPKHDDRRFAQIEVCGPFTPCSVDDELSQHLGTQHF